MEDQLWYERLPNLSLAMRFKSRILHLLLAVQLVAVLSLTSCVAPTPTTLPVPNNVQPLLLNLAQEEPDLVTRLIVQINGDRSASAATVTALGGQVVQELNLVNALVVDLPVAQVTQLAHSNNVRWISLDAPVMKSGEPGADIVLREDFSLRDPSSTRVVNWRWSELGEGDGMEEGDVALTLFFGGQQEGLRIQNGARGIESTFDLSLSSTASMSFSYRRKEFEANDAVRVEISRDGGASWHLLKRLSGPATDANVIAASYDLTPFVGSAVKLRFISEDTISANARFYLDFVQVGYNVVQPQYIYKTHLPYIAAPQPDRISDMQTAGVGAILTARDEFAVTSYQNNNGNTAWKTPWIESDPDGFAGPGGGDYVGVVNGRLQFHNIYRDHEMASRSADLAYGQGATLSFDWQTKGLDANELLAVLVSTSAAGPFTQLATFGGTSSGSFSVDISPYISSDTTVRFANRNYNWEWGEYAYIDNVQIQWTATTENHSQPPVTACTDCVDVSNLETIYPQAVGASEIWNDEIKKQGNDITVAVVDSGIAEHPDLTDKAGNSRILTHVDFTTGGVIDDFYGHGTHVAGSIAGNGKKSYGGYIGVAPQANLVDVKVTDDNGIGSTSSVIAGLEWILANKDTYNIRVVNMSLNSTMAESYHTSALNAAAEILWLNGIVVVVSSGNNGDNADAGILYPPANDPFVITVGASDDQWTAGIEDDTLAPFTAFGYTSDHFMKPEIIAPGTDIIAALASDDANLAVNHPRHLVQDGLGTYYFRMSGTSMAAGVAAGTVALLLSSEPTLTPDQVKYRLMETGASFAAEMGDLACELKVYANQLAVGWEDSSWDTTVVPSEEGLAVTYDAPSGALSYRAQQPLDLMKFSEIHFWAYGSEQGNIIKVLAYDADDHASPSPYWDFIPPNMWKEIVIPFSSLGNTTAVNRIAIQEGNGTAQPTFYIKDLSVAGPCDNITYLDIKAAARTPTTGLANRNTVPHMLLAKMAMIAYWASQNGADAIDWSSVNWNSVNWNSVNWNSVNWNSVNWNSVNWNSVNWNSVNWNSVNWNSVNWNSVNWNSVNWNSVNWNSVNWNSIKRNSVQWDD